MTKMPLWPHHLNGLSKLAPAHEQQPFAQHFLQTSPAEGFPHGLQPGSLRETLSWSAEHVLPGATCDLQRVSSQEHLYGQQARAGQLGRGATAKLVKGLEQTYRVPFTEDLSTPTQLGHLPSAQAQPTDDSTAQAPQQGFTNLLFPVSLQHVRAEAAAKQATARTYEPARAGLEAPCLSPPFMQSRSVAGRLSALKIQT